MLLNLCKNLFSLYTV